MTEPLERRPPGEGGPEDDLPEDLPPIADDEEAGESDLPIADLVDEQRDDGMSWLDDRVGIDDYDAEAIAAEIGALNEPAETSWTDGSEEEEDGEDGLEEPEDEPVFGDEYGWTEDNEAPDQATFDGDLELPPEGGPSVVDDAGEEGVEEDEVQLDTSSWTELGEEAHDDEEGPADLADEDLGIAELSYEQELRMGGAALPAPIDEAELKAAWLGPEGGSVAAVCFGAGSLWAAGAGLFRSERGRLVAAEASRRVEDAVATSVVVDPQRPELLYVGTMLGGLLRSEDGGRTLLRANSWTSGAPGCGPASAPSVPVQVALSGGARSTLWLRTGKGHLLRSGDRGESWERAAAGHSIVGLGADALGPAVAALGVVGQRVELLVGTGAGELSARPLPPAASRLAHAGEPRLAVSSGLALAGAEELGAGLVLASSTEAAPVIVQDCPRCTALAAASAPRRLAVAALFFAGRDLGVVVRSFDEGLSWVRLCEVGRLGELFGLGRLGGEETSSRIHDLALNPLAPGQLALATGHGVFVLEMKDV